MWGPDGHPPSGHDWPPFQTPGENQHGRVGGGGVQAPLGRPLPPRLSAMMPGKGVKSSSDRGRGAPCCPFHLARRVPTPSAASALRPRSPKALPRVQDALGVTDDFVKLRPPPPPGLCLWRADRTAGQWGPAGVLPSAPPRSWLWSPGGGLGPTPQALWRGGQRTSSSQRESAGCVPGARRSLK